MIPLEQESSFLVQTETYPYVRSSVRVVPTYITSPCLGACLQGSPRQVHERQLEGEWPPVDCGLDFTLLRPRHLNGRYVCFLYRNSGPSLGRTKPPPFDLGLNLAGQCTGRNFAYVLLVMAQGAGTRLSIQSSDLYQRPASTV